MVDWPELRAKEKLLADHEIGRLFFDYTAKHDKAWSNDGRLEANDFPTRRQLDHARDLFAQADEARAALVSALLSLVAPA